MKTKKCSKCGETRPLSEFYKDKAAKDGLSSWCKNCKNGANRKWKKTLSGKRSKKHFVLKKKYGISSDDHILMYILQNGRCKICKQHIDYDKAQTDHDHATGKVRGLLCNRCNSLLAAVDDKEFLAKAIEYLKESV